MALAVSAGLVKVAPVNIGVPPVGVVYQLNVAPAVDDEAVKVAVCPLFMVRDGGVTATFGALPMMTTPVALVAEGILVAGSIASA